MQDTTIVSVEAARYAVPLAEPLTDAMHGLHTHFDLILAHVRTADGTEGTGYTYTGGRGGGAILALLRDDLAPLLIDRDAADIDGAHAAMHWHVHYVGRGGIAGFALSALDIALWDLRGRREDQPLWRMAGGAGRTARAYCGGIDLDHPLDRLLGDVEGYLARGAEAVKIKVGKPDLAEDLDRARAVRAALGPGRGFMVDANYAFDIDRAIRAARAFGDLDVVWFEEPIDPEDYEGYAQIAQDTGVPLAMGENLHTMAEFTRALGLARLSYVQPDACNCGGITGWLSVARAARQAGLPVCSHGAQELHASLVAAQENAGLVEIHSFPIDGYTTRPVTLDRGRIAAPDAPGTGVVFDLDRLRPHEVRP